ncbi:MAG: hypothetical protein CIT03_06050 [Methanobacterium sp.]|nr:MAG: hypothetical protein CIT03_06050 [Methanobacterium sp.]
MSYLMIKIKHVAQIPEKEDGFRILVDRPWPPQLSADSIKIDCWYKDLAPTKDLDIWFSKNRQKENEFKEKYHQELKNKKKLIDQIKFLERVKKTLTLIYISDEEINTIHYLKDFLDAKSRIIRKAPGRVHGS